MARFRDWRYTGRDLTLIAVAGSTLLAAFLFAGYLKHRADMADDRAARQRAAICAILANLPSDQPPPIGTARLVFARAGHPKDCQPISRPHPHSRSGRAPRVSVTVIVTPDATASPVVSVRRRASTPPAPHRAPFPSPSPTTHPSPKPSPTQSPTPRPSVCVVVICIRR